MNINKILEKELNNKIKYYNEYISKELSIILGINEGFIINKLEHFFPVYIVSKNKLKLSLDMDYEKLPVSDLKLIEYLLDELDEENKKYIGSLSKDDIALFLLKESTKKFLISLDNKGICNYYFEQDIYQGSKSSDLDYINDLLIFMSINKKNNSIELASNNVSFEGNEYVYSHILNNLGIMITSNLHRSNIFIFDNPYLSQSPDIMESSIEEYFHLFYTLFKDILPLLFTDYNKFISIVGETNFINYSKKVINDDFDDIEEILANMYKSLLEIHSNIVMDKDTVYNLIKKYEKKRKI